MSEPIDITGPVREICDRLGVTYTDVGHLVIEFMIEPTCCIALVYKTNDEGKKYIDKNTGEPATTSISWAVVA